MSDYITANFDILLDQAPTTAAVYLRTAKREIDSLFGEGYAAKNPALVIEFIQAAASDVKTATNSKAMGTALTALYQRWKQHLNHKIEAEIQPIIPSDAAR